MVAERQHKIYICFLTFTVVGKSEITEIMKAIKT